MAIERTTNEVGFSIPERGTPKWGSITNQNWDLADAAFLADRNRITALENTSAILPLAIANKVGHNLVRNNIFTRAKASDPALAADWTSVFENGASGNTTRDSSTFLIGNRSQKVTIANVDLSQQTRPYSQLSNLILDPETNSPIATNDSRQLKNSFGYVFQTVSLSSKTRYTLSCYGKSEIPNNTLGINVHWKIGVVFKDTSNNIIYAHFTKPQTNLTSAITTDSFERAELSFVTPDLPVVSAEIWLINEGATPGGIGSSYFDGVQLEQASRATFLETFAVRGNDLFVEGNLSVGGKLQLQQDQLEFTSNKVSFSGNIQLGDDITEDVLDVFTKISTFHGPVTVLGNIQLGDNADPSGDTLQVTANKTTFFDNQDQVSPAGGDVEIQGDLEVQGNTILGSGVEDTVDLNATLVSTLSNASIGGDLTIGESLTVKNSVVLGDGSGASDKLTINMPNQGSEFTGDVTLNDDFFVVGDTILGSDPLSNTLNVKAGSVFESDVQIAKGLSIGTSTPVNTNINSTDVNLTASGDVIANITGSTTWTTSDFDLSGSFETGEIGTASQWFRAYASSMILGDSSFSTNTLQVYADTDIIGDGYLSGDLNIGGGSNGLFQFGTDIISASRSLVSFTGSPTTPSDPTGPYFGTNVIAGTIKLGDDNAIDIDPSDGYQHYLTDVYVNGRTTYFGRANPGNEVRGNVVVGGNLTVGGTTSLGNDLLQDEINSTVRRFNLNVGSGDFNIGGGYNGNTYNPTVTNGDHGGITFDNKGNLSMDGKLTVKGPIDPTELILEPITDTQANNMGFLSYQANIITANLGSGNTTLAITKEGTIKAQEGLQLGNPFGNIATITETLTSFGSSGTPLSTFKVNSNDGYFSGSLSVEGTLSTSDLVITDDATVSGDLNVSEDLVVSSNVTALGTQFTFGALTSTTQFNVLAHQATFGDTGNDVGDVTIANKLTVQRNASFGTDRDSDLFDIKAKTISFNIGSDRVDLGGGEFIDNAGFRIGGGSSGPGYQNNVYNDSVLDHGGVTIDAYGNIWADGSVFANGQFGINSIALTAPAGTNLCENIFEVLNLDPQIGAQTFKIDNLGHVQMDSYLSISDKYTLCAPDSYLDGYNNLGSFEFAQFDDGYAMIEVVNSEQDDRVFEVDNFGNVVADGQIITTWPGASSVGTYSVTVGDGYESHGDFNLYGNHNASSDPIGAAVSYIESLPNSEGTIFIKKGVYSLTSSITLTDGISLKGEGEGTILDGGSSLTGITCASNNKIKEITLKDCTTGISIGAIEENNIISDVKFDNCNTGVSIDGTISKLTHCTFTSHTTGITIAGTGHIITENSFKGDGSTTATGIILTGDECMLTSNYVVDHTTDGIVVSGNDNMVTGNITLRN